MCNELFIKLNKISKWLQPSIGNSGLLDIKYTEGR